MDAPTTLSGTIDYPRLAQRRALRRPDARRSQAHAGVPTTPARRGDRYRALSAAVAAPSTVPARPMPGRTPRSSQVAAARPHFEAGTVDTLPISLGEEFARIRDDQDQDRERRRVRRPRRPVLTGLLAAAGLLFLVAAVVIGPVIYRGARAYQDVFEEPVPHNNSPFVAQVNPEGTTVMVEATEAASAEIPPWDGEERLTILLLGVDRREDEPSRSDTMILVNIDPVTKRAAMMSIPRDLKVIIPKYGTQKINAAYAYGDADNVPGGGPGLVVRTIEYNFGITVDHYAQVDFDGFIKLVDTVGGVTLDVPYPIKDDEYPGPGNQYMRIYFRPGWQQMDGERVLQYARTRHDDGDSRRSARQQQVLLALRQQAVSLDLLPKATELLGEVGDAVRTDLKPTQALQLARLGAELEPKAIEQVSLEPALTEEQVPEGPYYLIPDWDAVGPIMSEFTGVDVVPPMSAMANPNRNVAIRIEDGTINPGLGSRVAQVLEANGFANVTVFDKPDLGNYPTSSIASGPQELTTANLIAGVLGIDPGAIEIGDEPPRPDASAQEVGAEDEAAGTTIDPVALLPTPKAGEETEGEETAVIVIVIGDDAPDPAYFTAEPFE